jgi:hypothetical protein
MFRWLRPSLFCASHGTELTRRGAPAFAVGDCVCCSAPHPGVERCPFCDRCFSGVSTVQDACWAVVVWAGIPVRQTPASAVDAMRLGLRWLAH